MPSLDFRKLSITQESVVFALAAALFVVFSLTLHNFLTPGNLIALVRSVSILGILGLGMGLVVIGRGIIWRWSRPWWWPSPGSFHSRPINTCR
jgi:ribose/xylose/arabinose/galactoside ABC-type transport system permease subunit